MALQDVRAVFLCGSLFPLSYLSDIYGLFSLCYLPLPQIYSNHGKVNELSIGLLYMYFPDIKASIFWEAFTQCSRLDNT